MTTATPQIRRVGQHAVLFSQLRQELLGEWLDERLGESHHYNVDLGTGEFVFTNGIDRVSATAHLVASIAVSPSTLIWGWAPMFDGRGAQDGATRHLREFGVAQQLDEFTTEEVRYAPEPLSDEEAPGAIAALSHDLGAAAVEALGPAFRYYSMPTGKAGSRFVVALDGFSEAPPEPDAATVFSRMARLLDSADDLGWSLDGLARLLPGWRCDRLADAGPRTPMWRLTTNDGRAIDITVEHDELGRRTSTKVSGVGAAP